jgi:hypothetical protein
MGNQIPIFHNRLAGYLMFNGFVLQNMGQSKNSKERKLNIYYFNDSEQLQNKIQEYRELLGK